MKRVYFYGTRRVRGANNIAGQVLHRHRNMVLLLIAALTFLVPTNAYAQSAGVCGRTDKVRVAIVAAAPVSSCGDVTSDHLSAITSLNLSRPHQ